MYESEHATRIIQLANRLQHEMANSYNPNRDAICALCQEIENSANAIYSWCRGIQEDDDGQT
jgi:transposase-like protein